MTAIHYFSTTYESQKSCRMVHNTITISGRVQGVGFRYTAREAANSLQITGFVRNMADGSVSIAAEGTNENMAAFLAWCQEGPPRSRIDHVAVMEGPLVGYTEFLIVY
jgi:acylphosphatase